MTDHIPIPSCTGLPDWLAANHGSSGTVWLAIWKQPDPRHVRFRRLSKTAQQGLDRQPAAQAR
jgi:hypothetical protein